MARETQASRAIAELHRAAKATSVHLEQASAAVASHLAAQEEPAETTEET